MARRGHPSSPTTAGHHGTNAIDAVRVVHARYLGNHTSGAPLPVSGDTRSRARPVDVAWHGPAASVPRLPHVGVLVRERGAHLDGRRWAYLLANAAAAYTVEPPLPAATDVFSVIAGGSPSPEVRLLAWSSSSHRHWFDRNPDPRLRSLGSSNPEFTGGCCSGPPGPRQRNPPTYPPSARGTCKRRGSVDRLTAAPGRRCATSAPVTTTHRDARGRICNLGSYLLRLTRRRMELLDFISETVDPTHRLRSHISRAVTGRRFFR